MNSFAAGCRTFSFLSMALIAAVLTLRAELIAIDDFEYESTVIQGCNGGFGWIGPWSGANLITVGSLRFGGLETKGHKLTTGGAQSDAYRCSFRSIATAGREHLLIDGKFGKPGTTLWIAFLINQPMGRNNGFSGISLCNGGREQVFLGDMGGSTFWGMESQKDMPVLSTVMADERIVFLAYRITCRATDVQFELWVDPKPGTNDPPVAEVAAASDLNELRFNRIRICSYPAPMSVDGLRIGTTFADVAPVTRLVEGATRDAKK